MTAALTAVLAHAERERDAQRATLQQAAQALARAQQQGRQLGQYHDELTARPPGGGAAVGIEQLRHHRSFVERLREALAQQQGQTRLAQQRCDAERQRLLALEVRVESVRRLLQRRHDDALAQRARREQRQGEEAALQRWLRTPRALDTETGY